MCLAKKISVPLLAAAFSLGLFGCSPEVGSERWCQQMQNKDKADWTANQAKDFARHCLL